jgi:hypothetical protein
LLSGSIPQIAVRRLREEPLQRTIFTATRVSANAPPAVIAVREALTTTARHVARERPDIQLAR